MPTKLRKETESAWGVAEFSAHTGTAKGGGLRRSLHYIDRWSQIMLELMFPWQVEGKGQLLTTGSRVSRTAFSSQCPVAKRTHSDNRLAGAYLFLFSGTLFALAVWCCHSGSSPADSLCAHHSLSGFGCYICTCVHLSSYFYLFLKCTKMIIFWELLISLD